MDYLPMLCSRSVAAFLLAGLIAGCNQTAPPQAATPSNAQIKTLQDRITALDGRINLLNGRIGRVEFAQNAARRTSVDFDPTESAYQRVDATNGVGSFAVSVEDVRAFGDGVRLVINLGNLSTAGFKGVKLSLNYGPRMPDPDATDPAFTEKMEAWNQSIKTKEVELTQTLQPGSWNPVNVTLPGIATDRFGFLVVSLTTSVITLTK